MQAPSSAMLSPIAVPASQPAGASTVSALPNEAPAPSGRDLDDAADAADDAGEHGVIVGAAAQ